MNVALAKENTLKRNISATFLGFFNKNSRMTYNIISRKRSVSLSHMEVRHFTVSLII